ncbi:lipopolysaccharide biosynthesis protein [Pseudomonas seleniipraecipitans]|uniref:Lipopolysaccharide biosynthesis protein n=1 Tax=Phytopseudomonas seleniipraecipitans TaxID=640205 RepID=A0ABY5J7L7_9GAMM|nr:lipopolysaccharide biosynthesis protein [Pseudomonas seleniipraecipitans]UUD64064.1 lipopolysaccharide biosynthesis protein [Pseudomonas seleniipraecipitans]
MTLMTGTGLAQVLPIVLSPVLTRLYTPQEFGVFALYASICAILAVLVTGKYELAIVVPKHDGEAINLAAVTIVLSVAVSFALLVAVWGWDLSIAKSLGQPGAHSWLYLIPFATMILGCYYALNFWANRRSRYRSMAISRVVQSGASCAVQLAAGVSKFGLLGLILGQLLGQLLSMLFLAKSLPQNERQLLRRISVKRMRCVAQRYIGYPKYMVPGQAMSVGAVEMPLLLLTIFFGAGAAGFYALAQRVMAAPLTLVSSAIGDVYRQKAADQYSRNGECLDIFLGSLKRLVLFAFLPVLPVLLFGPWIFAFVFGDDWRAAGEIASLLSVLVFFQTISSPLSTTVLFSGWLHLDTLWQFARLCGAGLVFYICDQAGADYKVAIIAYVCVFSSLYILHSYLQYRAARGRF